MASPAIYEDPGDPLPAAGARSLSIPKLDLGQFLAVLVFAALLRLLFFSGGLGTDEIVYLTHAHHVRRGDYLHTAYIGGARDGVNPFLPAPLWASGRGGAGAGE